jgi:hypothetical protein
MMREHPDSAEDAMHQPMMPIHRNGECTGAWLRHLVSHQALWQCTGCGFAFPESLPVLGAVRTEAMIGQLMAELASGGAEILSRQRQD